MYRVQLIHWNDREAREHINHVQIDQISIQFDPLTPKALREIRSDPPSAILIDLSRLPSQGRDLALNLRKYKGTRFVPLVFLGGDPKKVERIRAIIPDAVYTQWDELSEVLLPAIQHPVEDPKVPQSIMDAYAGAKLTQKLGIKEGHVVTLIGSPKGFETTLGKLPEGARVSRRKKKDQDIILWFVKSKKSLEDGLDEIGKLAVGGAMWIIWPKKASGVKSDLTQNIVRQTGLSHGLVDYKICSVDDTWSGLLFTWRK